MSIKHYNIQDTSLADIVINEYNPKAEITDERVKVEYERLKRSLVTHGYMLPLVVRINEKGFKELVDGEHRLIALKELGVERAQVMNLGEMSRDEAIERTLSIERIKIPLDEVMTAELLKELVEKSDIESVAERVPYDVTEIEAQIKMLAHDWQEDDGEGEAEAEIVAKDRTFTVTGSVNAIAHVKTLFEQIKDVNPELGDAELLTVVFSRHLERMSPMSA